MPTVEVTREGIQIDGRLFTLLAGQLHYFRYPRAEWRDLLLKARAAGINTIDTVIPWNLHEPRPGSFNFADEADIAGYADLCAELGLYLIVRPGPYICAEWENGGFPAWLTSMPDVSLRVDNPVYLEHLRRWFDTLLPPLAERGDDILPLAEHLLDGAAVLDEGARAALQAHNWPGNVRELKNALQRAALLCSGGVIGARDLGLAAQRATGVRSGADAEPDRAMIETALRNARGVISQAASELGLSRQALYRRMEKMGIGNAE